MLKSILPKAKRASLSPCQLCFLLQFASAFVTGMGEKEWLDWSNKCLYGLLQSVC